MLSQVIYNGPWYYLPACLVLACFISALLYFRNRKNSDIPKSTLVLMFSVRLVSVFLLSLLLLDILLKRIKNETQRPLILVAVDNSSSIIANADSTFVRADFTQALTQFKESIGKDFDIKTILFGSESKTGETPDFSEKETDLSNLMADIENNYANQNVGALILASDGIYNKGASPLFAAEKLGYPIYTIAMGDTSEVKDVGIRKINHNQFAYLGNVFPVEVLLNCKKFSGREVQVSIYHNGNKMGEQTQRIGNDNHLAACQFTLSADVAGVRKYTVQASILEGEKNIRNNTQSFLIEVIDNRYKILIIASSPHPDIAAIQDVLKNNSGYELKLAYAGEPAENIKAYSLVILHNYVTAQQSVVAECRNNNVPYWIVNPATSDLPAAIKVNTGTGKTSDAEPMLNPSFGLFSVSDELRKFLNDFPAVRTFLGHYHTGNGVNVMLSQKIGMVETGYPLLAFTEQNGLKSAIFIGDGLWRWKLRDFAEHNNHQLFSELISKCVQYLSVKADKSQFRVSAPRIVNENEPVEINAEVYNKSYELITEPEVSLTLTNADKKQFNYTFGKIANAYRLNLGFLPAGEYTYEAKVAGVSGIPPKNGIIIVKEVVAENINTVANHQLLFQMAQKSGGKMMYPSQIQLLTEEIKKNNSIKPLTYTSQESGLIIDLKWIFFVLLFLLAAEWLFRKRYAGI